MGRLEEALERLADQDRHLDPARVTDRLARRLRGGDLPVVVPELTADLPDPGRAALWRRRGPVIAFAGGVAAVVALAVPLLLVGRGETGAPATTPPPSTTVTQPTTAPATSRPPGTTTEPPTPTTLPPATAVTTTAAEPATTVPVEPFGPLGVTLVFTVDGSSSVAAGTFTASGGAVDAGVICPSGTSYESSYEAPGSGREERWVTVCTCDDGSGRFSLEVAATGEWEGGVGGSNWLFAGTWVLGEGTGAYVAMTGEGTNEGSCSGPAFDCLDTHTGMVWRDG